jgi:putative membrane protein
MTRNINRAVSLTSYFITLPSASVIVLAMLVLGLAFGFLFNLGRYYAEPASLAYNSIIDGMMLLAIPALLTSVVIKLLIRKMPYRRIAATALCGELVYAIAYGLSLLLVGVNIFWAQLVILVGAAIVFVFWYVIGRFVFILKYRSILFAVLQLLFYLAFLLSNRALYITSQPFLDVAAEFYLSAAVLLLALGLFFIIINAPMKKNLGVSSTDAMSLLFSQWLYHNKDMEKALIQVGERVKTLVCLMGFKRKDDTVFFVTPYVHYGPFGNLGGSEFSSLLAARMDARYRSKTLVFHGTVTHDLNPVSTSELDKITAAVDSMLRKAEYRDAKVSISVGKSEECRAQALLVNDSSMISLTRAPALTEDVNFGLGLSLLFAAEKRVRNAMIVDQHNSETGEITSFEPGSVIGFNYLSALEDALGAAMGRAQKKPLKVGVAFREARSPTVGSAGVKVAVLSSSPEYVIVLIDSNGMTPQLQQRIESSVVAAGAKLGRKFTVGVFTTDTHQTNMVRGVLNPLKEEDEMLAAVMGGLDGALEDMQPAEFFAGKEWFDINVIGAKQSIELISTINSIVAVSKILLPLILLGGILLFIAIATKL